MSYPSYLLHYSDELYHHGIKGQKWGERRYQFLDGTYTPLGKERRRYLNSDGTLNRQGRKVYKKITEKYKEEENKYFKNIAKDQGYVNESKERLNKLKKEGLNNEDFLDNYYMNIFYSNKNDPDLENIINNSKPTKKDLNDAIKEAKEDINLSEGALKRDQEEYNKIKSSIREELKEYGLEDYKLQDVDIENYNKDKDKDNKIMLMAAAGITAATLMIPVMAINYKMNK